MGNTKSHQMIDAASKIFNKDITNVLQKNVNNTFTNILAPQSAKLINKGTMICPPGAPLINQKIHGKFIVINDITADTANDIKILLKDKVRNDLSQIQKIVSEAGGNWGSNIDSKNSVDLSTELENIIEKNITHETLNEIVNQFSISQDGVVKNLGTISGSCTINQDMALDYTSSNIIASVIKNAYESEVIKEIENKIKQEQVVDIKGLSDIITAVGESVSGVMQAAMGPLVIIGILGFLFLIGGGKLTFRSGGSASKLLGILLILIVFGVIAYLVYAKSAYKWPFEPPGVREKGCLAEFNTAKKIMDELPVNKEDHEDYLKKHKKELDAFKDCMCKDGNSSDMCINEGYCWYCDKSDWINYKNRMRGFM